MNGPEHYRKAEEMLDSLWRARCNPNVLINDEKAATVLAEAQVHATLALAASNVHSYVPITEADREGWAAAVSNPGQGGAE